MSVFEVINKFVVLALVSLVSCTPDSKCVSYTKICHMALIAVIVMYNILIVESFSDN